jgi:hypothetical protein
MFFVQKSITFNVHALFFKRKTKTLQSKPLYSQLGFLVFYSLKERKIVLNKNSEFFVRVVTELARFQLRSVWPQGFFMLWSLSPESDLSIFYGSLVFLCSFWVHRCIVNSIFQSCPRNSLLLPPPSTFPPFLVGTRLSLCSAHFGLLTSRREFITTYLSITILVKNHKAAPRGEFLMVAPYLKT